MTTLTTFNANNLFVRYRWQSSYPADARPRKLASDGVGYRPAQLGDRLNSSFVELDPARRALAARALGGPDGRLPDVLCLQEVESMDALRALNERHLGERYEHEYLIDGRDPRNLDVAVLSRFPIVEVRPHLHERRGVERLFSRECLDLTLALPRGDTLTLFVNHLKSRYVEGDPTSRRRSLARANALRLAQAARIAELIGERFHRRRTTALYAVVGDLNDVPGSRWLAPLLTSPRLVDVLSARARPERWTWFGRSLGVVEQLDYVLASPALARRIRRVHIERRALGYRARSRTGRLLPRTVRCVGGGLDELVIPFGHARFAEIARDPGKAASDHCPVRVWF